MYTRKRPTNRTSTPSIKGDDDGNGLNWKVKNIEPEEGQEEEGEEAEEEKKKRMEFSSSPYQSMNVLAQRNFHNCQRKSKIHVPRPPKISSILEMRFQAHVSQDYKKQKGYCQVHCQGKLFLRDTMNVLIDTTHQDRCLVNFKQHVAATCGTLRNGHICWGSQRIIDGHALCQFGHGSWPARMQASSDERRVPRELAGCKEQSLTELPVYVLRCTFSHSCPNIRLTNILFKRQPWAIVISDHLLGKVAS